MIEKITIHSHVLRDLVYDAELSADAIHCEFYQNSTELLAFNSGVLCINVFENVLSNHEPSICKLHARNQRIASLQMLLVNAFTHATDPEDFS